MTKRVEGQVTELEKIFTNIQMIKSAYPEYLFFKMFNYTNCFQES